MHAMHGVFFFFFSAGLISAGAERGLQIRGVLTGEWFNSTWPATSYCGESSTIDYAVNLVKPVNYSSGLVAKGVKTSVMSRPLSRAQSGE